MNSQYRPRATFRQLFWLAGPIALLWLVLRSGTNPKRLAYPCQQAVMPVATGWLLAIAGLIGGSVLLRRCAKLSLPLGLAVGAFWFTATSPELTNATSQGTLSLPVWQVADPLSKVFVMDKVPRTAGSVAAGDSTVPNAYLRDPAIDTMLSMMGEHAVYLHETATHPTGIVGSNSVVIIKGNFQWNSQNTTSADRIKGLIWQILQHPGGFSGEILVCDNTQDIGTGINENDNNSEDPAQSVLDVVNTFRSKRSPVYCLDWNSFWNVVSAEYSTGDYKNGFVYENLTKISYPKFRSPSGRCLISMRYGVWDSASATYDKARLCIIDFPVLKAHSLAGATIAVKNWIGMLTTAYADTRYGGWTAMHSNYLLGPYALVARVMAATFPKLTIVDAAWTTTDGPVNLGSVRNTGMLLASTDPVAVSWYAAKFILTPIARYPNQTNPDLAGSAYRNSLGYWTTFLHDSAGYPCTRDSSKISVYDRRVLVSAVSGGSEQIPEACQLYQNYPNPFNPMTKIEFRLPAVRERNGGAPTKSGEAGIPDFGLVTLKVYDVLGREVATLVNEEKPAGTYAVTFDAAGLSSGIYVYALRAGEFVTTRKLLLLR